MPQFDPTWFASQLFWLVVSFTLLYLALSKVALPPLMRAIEGRLQKLSDDLAHAEKLRAEAEVIKTNYEHAMADARNKAQAAFNEAMAAAKKQSDTAHREMDVTLEQTLREAERRIATQQEKLQEGLKHATEELTAQILQKVSPMKKAG